MILDKALDCVARGQTVSQPAWQHPNLHQELRLENGIVMRRCDRMPQLDCIFSPTKEEKEDNIWSIRVHQTVDANSTDRAVFN